MHAYDFRSSNSARDGRHSLELPIEDAQFSCVISLVCVYVCVCVCVCVWRRIGEMLSLVRGGNWVAEAHCSVRTALGCSAERAVLGCSYLLRHPT